MQNIRRQNWAYHITMFECSRISQITVLKTDRRLVDWLHWLIEIIRDNDYVFLR